MLRPKESFDDVFNDSNMSLATSEAKFCVPWAATTVKEPTDLVSCLMKIRGYNKHGFM